MKTRLLNQIMRTSQALEEEKPAPQEIEMQGPLSVIYAKALDLAYSTTAPAVAPADAAHTTVPAVESQAMDEMIAVQTQAQAINKLHDIIHGGEADSIRIYTTGSGVSETTETDVSAQAVFKDALSFLQPPNDGGGGMVDFVFVESAMAPSVDSPVGGNNSTMLYAPSDPAASTQMSLESGTEDDKVVVAVESIQVIIKTRQVRVSDKK